VNKCEKVIFCLQNNEAWYTVPPTGCSQPTPLFYLVILFLPFPCINKDQTTKPAS